MTSSQECPICQEQLTTGSSVLPRCGHMFHEDCVTAWMRSSSHCPVCRRILHLADLTRVMSGLPESSHPAPSPPPLMHSSNKLASDCPVYTVPFNDNSLTYSHLPDPQHLQDPHLPNPPVPPPMRRRRVFTRFLITRSRQRNTQAGIRPLSSTAAPSLPLPPHVPLLNEGRVHGGPPAPPPPPFRPFQTARRRGFVPPPPPPSAPSLPRAVSTERGSFEQVSGWNVWSDDASFQDALHAQQQHDAQRRVQHLPMAREESERRGEDGARWRQMALCFVVAMAMVVGMTACWKAVVWGVGRIGNAGINGATRFSGAVMWRSMGRLGVASVLLYLWCKLWIAR